MKSVFLTPKQLLASGELLRGRSVGVLLFDGAPFDEKRVAKSLGAKGARFLGISPAVSFSQKNEDGLAVQIATAERSARLHTLCSDSTGSAPPYRIGTEPGRLYWQRGERERMTKVTEVTLKLVKPHLPAEICFEISQNEVSNPLVLGGLLGYLDWFSEREPVCAGIQVWLNKWASVAPGVVMGAMNTLASRGFSASISEFGVLAPSPPYPSTPPGVVLDWEEWREKRVTEWLLQTGISPEEAPYWGPLDAYSHGPYCHTPFPSLEAFDAFYEGCYSRGAQGGGPFGVGTDFRRTVANGRGRRGRP